jgi:hypothetical protein
MIDCRRPLESRCDVDVMRGPWFAPEALDKRSRYHVRDPSRFRPQ